MNWNLVFAICISIFVFSTLGLVVISFTSSEAHVHRSLFIVLCISVAVMFCIWLFT